MSLFSRRSIEPTRACVVRCGATLKIDELYTQSDGWRVERRRLWCLIAHTPQKCSAGSFWAGSEGEEMGRGPRTSIGERVPREDTLQRGGSGRVLLNDLGGKE